MDKNIILEKSRKENILGDERQKEIKQQSLEWGFLFGSLAFLLVMGLSFWKPFDTTSAKIVFTSMILGEMLFRWKKRDNSRIISLSMVLIFAGGAILLISWIVPLVAHG